MIGNEKLSLNPKNSKTNAQKLDVAYILGILRIAVAAFILHMRLRNHYVKVGKRAVVKVQ